MSTITREQAQKIIDAADEVITALAGTNEDVHPESDSMLRLWDDLNDHYAPPEVVRELARIALDAQAAAPVYQWRERYVDSDLWDDCTKEQYEGFAKRPDVETRILYTAPPAPVVPEEATPNNIEIIASARSRDCAVFQWDEDQRNAAADSWNACRAAMLQAGNSPVTPDGYVLVPIVPTENMIINGFESEPDELFSKSEEWDAYQEMSGCEQAAHRAKLCWAAMIKAAPKQENK
ncbi:DUF551 domain-containing protein [Citrobacter sp. wls617]|uniref:DUF551 domain-containing protein n=1 Tax=Citrobacter sp. wls617 TaxID=2576434 RepID=UPI0010C94CD7|nr:DUF551 domain-containing protein [Citrobacter sp. wls617]TKU92263.1 DUF551 domain-containing protein [Citrobacter sp. wls617]